MRVLVLPLVLLLAGCNVVWRDTWAENSRTAAVLTAQIRRTQLINQVVILERLQRRAPTVDGRVIIQSHINRALFEIEQLNVIIERGG